MTENMPSPQTFCADEVLYRPYEAAPAEIVRLCEFRGHLDLYCVECRNVSVFHCTSLLIPPDIGAMAPARQSTPKLRFEALLERQIFILSFACARDKTHIASFIFRATSNSVCKIGQYPSLSDLHSKEIAKYRDVLGARYAELHRSIRLAANGIGIGAFVYLRRIFESIVEEVHQDASNGENWDEEGYQVARWDEKIAMLQHLLPRFLVDNKSMYGILSKGIHELSEPECSEYFAVLRTSLELILDQRMEQRTREEKEADAARAIAKIQGELSSHG